MPAIIGGNIRFARAKRGLHQGELADMLGMSRGTISQIERGARVVTVDELLPLCVALDVDLAFLMDGMATADLERLGI